MKIEHTFIELETEGGMAVHDITPLLRERVAASGIRNGVVTVTSQHTTTALILNEHEERLLRDMCTCFERLAPPWEAWLHNDIAQRDCPPDEPENAHSHLLAMLVGSSETVSVVDGALDLGQWQSVMLVELDGPRERTLSLRIWGE